MAVSRRGARHACGRRRIIGRAPARSQSATHVSSGEVRGVCDLASVLHADDERHEVQDRDALGKARSRRPSPHLLSQAEIRRIMHAALELALAGSITPLTFHYVLGPIAAPGLRRSEANGLLPTNLTADDLLIRRAKSGKRCLVLPEGSVHGTGKGRTMYRPGSASFH